MESDVQARPGPKTLLWVGRVLSALPALALIASGVGKLLKPEAVVTEFTRLGWPDSPVAPLGIVEIACALLYAIPQTAVLGAILLTGYLGGAIATHVRIEEGFLPPLVMGVLVWLGIYLRDRRLRALLPFRSLSER
jgi:xanthine/uracil permease